MKEKGREVKKKTRNGVTEKERKNKRRMMRKIKLRIKEKRKEEEGQDVEDKGQRGGCWFESCLSLHVLWVQQSHLSTLCF